MSSVILWWTTRNCRGFSNSDSLRRTVGCTFYSSTIESLSGILFWGSLHCSQHLPVPSCELKVEVMTQRCSQLVAHCWSVVPRTILLAPQTSADASMPLLPAQQKCWANRLRHMNYRFSNLTVSGIKFFCQLTRTNQNRTIEASHSVAIPKLLVNFENSRYWRQTQYCIFRYRFFFSVFAICSIGVENGIATHTGSTHKHVLMDRQYR